MLYIKGLNNPDSRTTATQIVEVLLYFVFFQGLPYVVVRGFLPWFTVNPLVLIIIQEAKRCLVLSKLMFYC